MSRRIEKLLDKLGYSNNRVKSLHGANFGHLALSVKGDDYELTHDKVDMKILDDALEIFQKTLEDHPNIFGYKKQNENKFIMSNQIANLISFELQNPVSFTMKIPESQRKFQFLGEHREEFKVIIIGSNHIAYVELDDAPAFLHIGHEFREQIRHQLSISNTNFELGTFGPSPIHPEIYCVCLEGVDNPSPDIRFIDGDIFVIIPYGEKDDINKIYDSILKSIDFPMFDFYSLQKQRAWLIEYYSKIDNTVRDLLDLTMQVESAWPILNLLKFRSLSSARVKLINEYSELANYEQRISFFSRGQDRFLDLARNNQLLGTAITYFEDIIKLEPLRTDTIIKNLEFVERTITSRDQILNSLLSALIGGIVGAIIGVYASK